MDSKTILKSFHAEYTGATSKVLAPSTEPGGGSYQRLASAVSRGPVLDLGCGDGYLSAILIEQGLETVGIDMSSHEIALARARMGPTAALHVGHAEDLPYPDNSFATVVSHMSLMLIDSVEDVVAEIRRVLRPGGVLLATMGRWQPESLGERSVLSKVYQLLDAAGVDSRIGNAECSTTEGIESLFAGPCWGNVAVEHFELSMGILARDLEEWLSLALYPLYMLPPRCRQEFTAWLAMETEQLAPEGVMNWTLGARQYCVPCR